MLAHDVMTTNPRAVDVAATVRDVLEVLDKLDVRHVPVINAQREVVGMLSDRDLQGALDAAIATRATGKPAVLLDEPVTRFMTGGPVTVEEDEELSEVVDAMVEHRIGAVPVVDADGVLVGIVSYVDVLREAFRPE